MRRIKMLAAGVLMVMLGITASAANASSPGADGRNSSTTQASTKQLAPAKAVGKAIAAAPCFHDPDPFDSTAPVIERFCEYGATGVEWKTSCSNPHHLAVAANRQIYSIVKRCDGTWTGWHSIGNGGTDVHSGVSATAYLTGVDVGHQVSAGNWKCRWYSYSAGWSAWRNC